jgi:acyl-CoA reductase-like NAD-dependent aldehyde dehydrogenase
MPENPDWNQKAADIRFDVRAVIAGRRTESRADATLDCFRPSDGSRLYVLPEGSAADVDLAVGAARGVFDAGHWADMSPVIRKVILNRFAGLVDAHQDELALFDSVEMGKPITQARGDVDGAAHIIRYYAEFTDKAFGTTAPTAARLVQYTRREPRGVVAAIIPWNYPMPNAALKVAPALAAGNSVVLKPSELSSMSALRLAELAVEAGIPPGTFNVVPGRGATVGAALAAHDHVDLVAFTGSTVTGKALLALVGQTSMKPLQLECGGKSANLVLSDIDDLDTVAQDAAQRIFANGGQLCVAGTRLIAHESVKDELVEKIVECARSLTIGDPLDPSTDFGPLASAARRDAVLESCSAAVAAGATLRCGGGDAAVGNGGYFVEPAVLDGVKPEMAIAQEDVFGPVLAVLSFDDVTEAILLANNSRYGLSATVWTRDLATSQAAIHQLRVGRITILSAAPDPSAFAFPMGAEPYGQSGFGAEAGADGFYVYTRLKAIELHV